MRRHAEIQQGALALMVLKTLDALGPLHGLGAAGPVEQFRGARPALNRGVLNPSLLRLEQDGAIGSACGPSAKNRRTRFYRLARAGRKQLQAELLSSRQSTEIIARFLAINAEAPL